MATRSSRQVGVRPHLILIVEDDDMMHVFYKALFRRHKDEFVCHFEKSAAAALGQISRQ